MAVVGLLVVARAGGAPAAPETRPNIVFIISDDRRWDNPGVAGNPNVQTPNVDRLAREGTVWGKADKAPELYDLVGDPREEKNLYDTPKLRSVQETLSSRLIAWLGRTKDT